MPQRQNVKRIHTAELQGDDSWLEIAYPTQKEMKQYNDEISPLTKRLEQFKADSDLNSPEAIKVRDALNAAGEGLITRYVKRWNWVDNDGNPLPPPDTPNILDDLTLNEIRFITKLFAFTDEEKKA